MKSKAVVFRAKKRVEFSEVTCPDPGPEDVVVRVTHSWISNGTEGSYLRGERIAGDTPYRQGDPTPFPIIAGYQKIGVIEWVGEHIHDLSVGEVVFAALGRVENMFEPHGGHVSPSVCRRDQVWKLPRDMEPLAFAGLVLTQVGYNCGQRPTIESGERAVVIGDGLVGHWAAQTLAWRGANITMVGRHDERLALFAGDGRQHTINSKRIPWTEAIRDTNQAPIGVVVDTVGSVATLEESITLLRRYGQIVSAGFYGIEDRLPLQTLRDGEKTIHTVAAWTQERMDRTLDLITQGHLCTLPLITHRLPVEQASAAWALIESKREPVLGVILEWNHS